MTIDPNATLTDLRAAMGAELRDASHTTDLSRTYRAAQPLLVHLDAGGPLPDAWTPFYTPSADLAAALQTIEHAADQKPSPKHGHTS